MTKEQIISENLMKIGIRCSLKGFLYLKTAILMCLEDKELIYDTTKRLYPILAAKFNASYGTTERNIRHAIEIAWDRTDNKTLKSILGPCVRSVKMTNSEFIATFVERYELQLLDKAS